MNTLALELARYAELVQQAEKTNADILDERARQVAEYLKKIEAALVKEEQS